MLIVALPAQNLLATALCRRDPRTAQNNGGPIADAMPDISHRRRQALLAALRIYILFVPV